MGFECGAKFKIGADSVRDKRQGKGRKMVQEKITAIVLAAGRGTRMESKVQKQYMTLAGKPLIYHALAAFEKSTVDRIVLVTGAGEEEYCREEIVKPYGFSKVRAIVSGGKERYHSVYEGLKAAEGSDYVLIHDGARPCVTPKIIQAAIEGAKEAGACVVGMPVKDTIKIADDFEYAASTPDRSRLWLIQTPQAFSYSLARKAYETLFESEDNLEQITDDAMVVEHMTAQRVKLIRGSYQNIKVTTPEDLTIAEKFLQKRIDN